MRAVRLARNLRHGIVLVVGDVVDQRFCLGAILGPEVRCVERSTMSASKKLVLSPPQISHIATRSFLVSGASQALRVCVVLTVQASN